MEPKAFGAALRRLRREADLTLSAVADHLKVSAVYISQLERGEKPPPAPKVIADLMHAVGRPELVGEMMLLANKSRRSIEISLENKPEEEKNLLAALARRSQEGKLSPELAAKMLDLLNGSNDPK